MNIASMLPDPFNTRLEQIISTPQLITFVLRTIRPQASCPRCAHLSAHIHSRYIRTIADLPCFGVAVSLQLQTRKYFCRQPLCSKRVFCERLPALAAHYARRTVRLHDALRFVGLTTGGEVGARLAGRLGITLSPDTLLRRIRQSSPVECLTPRVLGVDDFAFRRGQRYGTILVDLERRTPVDLLPDREAATLEAWLIAHPGVEIISRDRAAAYAEGARKGAPDAVQVADRFHLLQNLREAIERMLGRQHKLLREAAESLAAAPQPQAVSVGARVTPGVVKQTRAASARERRLARYTEIRELYKRGATIKALAEEFRMHRRTVRQFIRSDEFPERASAPARGSQVDRFRSYLKQRWDEGCHTAAQLWYEITAQGFCGSESSVRHYVARWRAELPEELRRTRGRAPLSSKSRLKIPSSRRVVWWLLERQELEAEQQEFVEKLCGLSPEVRLAQSLAKSFFQMVNERQRDDLDTWINAAANSRIPELESFAAGLRKDPAVEAALSYEWSQGPVEGHVNRLKMIKREMFGRAKFDLLRVRVLKAA